MAVDEFLIAHGSRIKDPDIKAMLESILDGSIAANDPRLTTYAELLQDIEHRSATLARLEATDMMGHVEDSLREDLALGFQIRSVDEILRPADLPWWRQLLLRLRPPRIVFNHAPQFARELMGVEPALRLRSLKRSARHTPMLSPLELITVLRIFPANQWKDVITLLTERHNGGTAGCMHHYDVAQIARAMRLAPEATRFFLTTWNVTEELPRLRALATAATGDDAKAILAFLDEMGTAAAVSDNTPEPEVEGSADDDIAYMRGVLHEGLTPEVQLDIIYSWLKKQKYITEESLLYLLEHLPRGAKWGWGNSEDSKTEITPYKPLESLFVKYGHTNWRHVGYEPMDRIVVVKALQLVRWTSEGETGARLRQTAYDNAVSIFRRSSTFARKIGAYKVQSEALLHQLVYED
jgi:hypothetical protein